MKHMSRITSALVLSSTLVAVPAFAAGAATTSSGNDMGSTSSTVDRGTNKSPNAQAGGTAANQNSGDMSASSSSPDRGTNKSPNAQVRTENEASGSMPGGMMSSEEIGHLKTADVQSLNVVRQSQMANTDKSVTKGAPMDTTVKERRQIQAALEANPKIVTQLKQQSVDVSQVVAANYDGNGTLTVYVQ